MRLHFPLHDLPPADLLVGLVYDLAVRHGAGYQRGASKHDHLSAGNTILLCPQALRAAN